VKKNKLFIIGALVCLILDHKDFLSWVLNGSLLFMIMREALQRMYCRVILTGKDLQIISAFEKYHVRREDITVVRLVSSADITAGKIRFGCDFPGSDKMPKVAILICTSHSYRLIKTPQCVELYAAMSPYMDVANPANAPA